MRSVDEIPLAPVDRQAVRRAAAVLRDLFPVARIVLFGSKVRGAAAPESDIDLLVLTRRPLDQRTKAGIVEALYDLQLELGVVVSTLVASVEEWEQGYFRVLPIHDEVEREGVLA